MDSGLYRFATFNCKNVKRSCDDVRNLCRSCDVVCLQETWLMPHDVPYIGTIDSGFGYTATSAVDTSAGILRGRPHGGTALLWRQSLFRQVTVIQCNNPRICAIKIITGDRPVIVMSVYLPTNTSDNLQDFTYCLSAVSAIVDEYGVESVFVLGDFNANPGELFYSELVSICEDQSWFCIDVDMLGLDSGTYTFISDVHGTSSWLDHCIATRAARQAVVGVNVEYDTWWSDHFPVIIKIHLHLINPKTSTKVSSVNKDVVWGVKTDEQICLYTRECTNRLKCIDFPSECSNCADQLCGDRGHRHVLDKLYADIVTALRDAAALAGRGGARNCGGGSRLAGWSACVGEAHGEARAKFNMWIMCGRPKSGISYKEMRDSRRVFKSRLKWCQKHQDQIKMDALAAKHSNGDFRGFWKSTGRFNARSGLPVSVEGVSDSVAIANLFRDQFTVKSLLDPRDVDSGAERNNLRVPLSATLYRAKDVTKALRNMSTGKSPGHDGLSVEHLRYAGPHVSRVLAMFYSLCVSHSYLPADFMKTVVVPVVKNKTGDLSDKSNYRPISLATIIAKVFDGLLNTQLNKYIRIHDNQFGFRPGLSTESAILCLKHTVKYYVERKTPVYACFLDLSRAFDLVGYNLLWDKLKSIDLPQQFVNIFQYWYEHQLNSVRWAGAMSDPYRLECGVRQGGLTSPTLFNLYINGLIAELSSQHVGCHIDGVCVNNLSYADDMVLLSASVCGLRRLIRTCEEYAGGHGLIYNVKKSQYMVFEAVGARCPSSVPQVKLNGIHLARVDSFKYLGHILTTDLRDHADMERERRALSVRANMLARRFAQCSRGVKVALFKAYCTSLYSCSLWADYSQTCYSALRVQYNNAFRAVLGLSRRCSASGMFMEARTDGFHATMRKRAGALVRRVRASSNNVLAMIAQRHDCLIIRNCCDRHISVHIPPRVL
ncbi:uncharacterized protein LOC111360568 [Spodoptera litura]|uniref:Uncharacterized protein LOC111360568 n=1 Tax=Spodoptera litura TaxID=69820 RepID=A0A9J7EPI7_SPOLT|nr:uncharacterized protein LOC111360568 [Spodoptera litura]